MVRYIPNTPRPSSPGQPPEASQDQRSRAATLPQLAPRLSERDRLVVRTLWDHHVLTTGQIAQLAYPNPDRARRRMLRLAQLGVTERFRPLLPPGEGSAPLHHLIGPAGARLLAAERDIPPSELGYRRDRIHAWIYSPRLAHLIGVNGVFTALTAAARRSHPAELTLWWPERRCQQTWAPYARPDGFGRWREGGTGVDFFLEYDTGTEPLNKVAAKLSGYAKLAEADGYTTPVLIWTSTPTREANLHRRLRAGPVPVFTTTDHTLTATRTDPAGPIWLPAGHTDAVRLRLITLARYAQPYRRTLHDDT